jgi:hypothetical protein
MKVRHDVGHPGGNEPAHDAPHERFAGNWNGRFRTH